MLKLEVDDRDMSSLMDAAKDLSDAINRMLNSAKVRRHVQYTLYSCIQSSCSHIRINLLL